MAVTQSLATGLTVVTVNGRRITDWGQSDSPIVEEPIDQKRSLVRGLGGNGAILERINQGRRVTLSVMPASPDSAYLHGLYESGAIITYTRTQVGSLESSIGMEGISINENQVARGGAGSFSDDTFVFEFNVWQSVKGGE